MVDRKREACTDFPNAVRSSQLWIELTKSRGVTRQGQVWSKGTGSGAYGFKSFLCQGAK